MVDPGTIEVLSGIAVLGGFGAFYAAYLEQKKISGLKGRQIPNSPLETLSASIPLREQSILEDSNNNRDYLSNNSL